MSNNIDQAVKQRILQRHRYCIILSIENLKGRLVRQIQQKIGIYLILAFSIINQLGISSAQAEPFDGYTLYNGAGGRTTYLLDMDGDVQHSWDHNRSGGYEYTYWKTDISFVPSRSLIRDCAAVLWQGLSSRKTGTAI